MVKLEIGDGALTNFLNQIPIEELKKRVEDKGYFIVSNDEAATYVNIEKSMGTEPFYDMLVDAIEKGDLNLELLVGKVALKKIMPKSK